MCHGPRHTSGAGRPWTGLVVLALLLSFGIAAAQDYVRPVDTAPTAEDIGADYSVPPVQRPLPRGYWLVVADVVVLGVALSVAAYLVHGRRSRRALWVLAALCLAYFGFHREGCVCPVGATQNVAASLVDPGYAVPLVVLASFFLPLAFALVFGRVFCSGVCPLGAIQEVVLVAGLRVPRPVDRALGSLKYVYLLLALWFATRPAESRDFLICRFDPFVGMFRFAGPGWMLMTGGGLLLLSMFVGRPYCRYLCPYGGLLALTSRLAWKRVSITPDRELDCGLCLEACPYGAIEKMRAVPSKCLACARCYSSCPRQHAVSGTGPAGCPR